MLRQKTKGAGFGQPLAFFSRETFKEDIMTNKKIDQLDLKRLTYYEDRQSCGTMAYYYLTPYAKMVNLVSTDGIYLMCEALSCHWVIDEVALATPMLSDVFYVVYIIPNEEGGFYFIMDDGNYNKVVVKEYPFTDLEQNLKMYLQRSDRWVLLLPSEY
jgi:hypothetical protein